MKLFISWSGVVSQQLAEELRNWIPLILPAVEPFITTSDIDKGARWQGEISMELSKCNYGIVCLTRENLASQGLAFEAGALSKQVEGRVATVLFGLEHRDIQPPLSMFQGTIFNEADIRKLVSDVDQEAKESKRGEQQLDKIFPAFWPMLKEPVELILQNAANAAPPVEPTAPNFEAIAQEMMALLRMQNAVLSAPEKFLAPVLDAINRQRLEKLVTKPSFDLWLRNVTKELDKRRAVPTAAEIIEAAENNEEEEPPSPPGESS